MGCGRIAYTAYYLVQIDATVCIELDLRPPRLLGLFNTLEARIGRLTISRFLRT
jgi:hypothetical protein